MARILRHEAEDAPSVPNYAQVVEVTEAQRLVFVSGQIPMTAGGDVPDGFEAQARLTWQNIIAQLSAVGMGLDDVVKVTVYLSDRRYTEPSRIIREEVLGGRQIGLTCIICDIFDPAWLLEIEAIAAA